MLNPSSYLERGDGPAQAVLRSNAEQQAVRKAIETQEELHKIRERVCITLSAYEIGEELAKENQNSVEKKKNAFVKEDTELAFVDDMAMLYLILSDPIAKRKYHQKVTIFVVGYENLCDQRNKLLVQLQQFFTQNTASDDTFTPNAPEFDFDEMENNVRDALAKAEKTTERLTNISKDVLKVFEMVNLKDHKRGKRKLEKSLFQSQQDVMHLTEKLVEVQSEFEDAKTKLSSLNKQLEVKEAEVDRLQAEVDANKTFERECIDLRNGLQAKEQQLQTYRKEMDKAELSLSQVESKYDEYVEMCRSLRDENEHLKTAMEAQAKEKDLKLDEIRQGLETRFETEMNELKANQEKEIAQLKEYHEDELFTLQEKLDSMRRRSLATGTTSVPNLPPDSRDSARFSSSASERALSAWKYSAISSARIMEIKSSEDSRLNTASSEVEDAKEKDSVLDRSSSIFVSMSGSPAPKTPKTADTLAHVRSREVSPARKLNVSTQTDDVIDGLGSDSEIPEAKSDLLQIEREMAKTPTNELPEKLDEHKKKFTEIEQQLHEDVLQWKLRFNAKSQALNELMLSQEKHVKEKEGLMEQLSVLLEQKTAAEQEAERAILDLEDMRAEREYSSNIAEDDGNVDVVQTENRGTATSASLYRMQQILDVQESTQTSVGVQCPSAPVSRAPSIRSPLSSEAADEQEALSFGGLNASDSGFGSSNNVLHAEETELLQNAVDPSKFAFHPRSPSSIASNGRVRSRLMRSALRDHRVVVETVKTYEMITKFKANIVIWLQQHGLGHKTQLLTAIPDIRLNKEDELDVLSKISEIRDTTQQILGALWQATKDDYSWSQHELIDGSEKTEDNMVHSHDVESGMDTVEPQLTSPVAKQRENADAEVKVQLQEDHLQDRSVQTARHRVTLPTPTTPKGYTRLLHEYNNLSEEYDTLTQQLQENVKSYQEQIQENASVMNEMKDTINKLRSQLIDGNLSGRISTQPSISSQMFTRLDAERNVKSMKKAVLTRRLSEDSYNTVLHEMKQYVSLPGRRLAELVKRYRHHCIMKDVEENLIPARMTSAQVYHLQEKMELLQRSRALNWSDRMAELGKERSELGDKITSSLKEIEERSGIFLIKPVYSYVSRSSEVLKSSHPVICKKRSPQSPERPSEAIRTPSYPLETARTPGWAVKQGVERPMWKSKDSVAAEGGLLFDDNPIPRLLAMDVNRYTLSKNLISGSIDAKSTGGGVRQYVTVERPIGTSRAVLVDRVTKVPTPSRDTFPEDSCASSPGSFTPYPPLPPISLPHSQVSSATSATNQSGSPFSVTPFDENLAR